MEKSSDGIRRHNEDLAGELRKARNQFALLLRKAKDTLIALNVEMLDEAGERGHPSGCPATVNWALALKSHPAHGVIGRDRGATTKQQSQGKEEELMDKKRKGAKKKGPKQEGCKTVPVRREIIEAQRQRFIEKFGRDWGPHDPIFFDPSADEPRPMIDEVLDQHLLEAMHKAGIRPAMIYAYQKTGRLVTYKNRKHLTKAELKKWNDAVNEWYELH